jgi:acyl-[acyl-carrier-protein]-phospholipid O-acyltransferase / long-chain-fatty-acid--[acyl-carrier-protein] ligase
MLHYFNCFFFSRRFLPLFIVQATGAFNDNLLKQALGLFIIYNAGAFGSEFVANNGEQVLIIANVLFTLPFFLFSAFAGQLADKFEKSFLIRAIKIFEVGIMTLASIGFFWMNIWVLFLALFLMGLHSALFGPIKYSILPDHLGKDELITGNALVEGGTFLAILMGTLLAGPLVQVSSAAIVVPVMLLIVAGLGVCAGWRVPKAQIADPDLVLDRDIFRSTLSMVRYSAGIKPVFLSIVGISWFWVFGALFVTLFAPFAKDDLGGNQEVVSAFLAMFSIGIAVGSLLCSKALHGEISAKYVPLGACGMTLFAWDLAYCASSMGYVRPGELVGLWELMNHPGGLRVLTDLTLIAVSGGFFVVPLYAIMQNESEIGHRARVVASNNIINSFSIVAGSALVVALQFVGWGTTGIFAIFAALNLVAVVVVCELLPRDIFILFLRTIVGFIYRVEVRGLENLREAGSRVVIIANHASKLDSLLLALFLPESPVIGLNNGGGSGGKIKEKIDRLVQACGPTLNIQNNNPFSIKAIVQEVKSGKRVVLFPEGRATVTGTVMKVSEVPVFVAAKADAVIVPVHLDGPQYSLFSLLNGRVRRKWFPKIIISVLPATTLDAKGSKKKDKSADKVVPNRAEAARKVYDVLTAMALTERNINRTLSQTVIEAARTHGRRKIILEDSTRQTLTYAQLMFRAHVLSRLLRRRLPREHVVGVMMPNCVAHVVAIFGLSLGNFVPAMLNFAAGPRHVRASCEAARIKVVLTIRPLWNEESISLVRKELEDTVEVVFLEDLKSQATTFDAAVSWFLNGVASWFGSFPTFWNFCGVDTASPQESGVILFTSGSEGLPKGVALSHRSLVSNFYQLDTRVDFAPSDRVFNALPLFHSFGLSVGTLLPLFSGMKCFLYPSPLHYKAIADLVYETGSTIMFGTDTFLRGYAKAAHSYDFFRIQYVFAGAEKLNESTRNLWFERFGIRLFEGYGTTETAPVLSMNTSMFYKSGSVGRLLPGVEFKIRAIDGIEKGGVLEVKGPNVMAGYFRTERPGVLQPLPDGWYDTGDVVTIDEEGFLYIIGRVKRFAKIAGEMISLLTVESILERHIVGHRSAIVVRPHKTHGEELVLVTESSDFNRRDIAKIIKEEGYSAAWAPRNIQVVTAVPTLPSGKVDYTALEELVKDEPESSVPGKGVL